MKRNRSAQSGPHVTRSYSRKALPLGLVRRIVRTQQERIYERFAHRFPPRPEWRVLNLGEDGEPQTRSDAFFQELYPYRSRITATGVEEGTAFRARFPDVKWVKVVRGEPLPFADRAFDVVFCSAVVEHVGSRSQQARFVREVFRVADRIYLTTPNRWYPVELHTMLPLIHWLPPAVHRPVLRRLGFDFFAEEENLNLLPRSALLALVPGGFDVRVESHRFLGLPSNHLLFAERLPST